ncbi:MAG: HEPN domain-containing protein [Thermotogota bacterium]|nr:HEPN domain-containing protein [Thermotogota bacterium]
MTNREKFNYWLEIAQYDLDTARAMFDSGRYLYVAFTCQQSIEKISKGLYTLITNNEPPRIHNIWQIFRTLKKEPQMKKLVDIVSFDLELNKHKLFFAELLSYYISGRYPTYKEKISSSIVSEKQSIYFLQLRRFSNG